MANKRRTKIYFPALDEAIAAYQRRNRKTQMDLAKYLDMSPATFASKRNGESEFSFTEFLLLCELLGLGLEAAAEGREIKDLPEDVKIRDAVVAS